MNKNFNSIEEALSYRDKLIAKEREYSDLEFNLEEQLKKSKTDIEMIKENQSDMRRCNYSLWEQETQDFKEVSPIEENEVSLSDVINNIL